MIKYLLLLAVVPFTPVLGQYTGCDYQQNMNLNQIYDIFSPGYPNQNYLSGTNCRWRAIAPPNCVIQISCFDMRLPQSANCADRLEMSFTGTYNDPSPTYACSGQTFTRTIGNQLVIALRSQATGFAGGLFRCQIMATPQNNYNNGVPIGNNIGK